MSDRVPSLERRDVLRLLAATTGVTAGGCQTLGGDPTEAPANADPTATATRAPATRSPTGGPTTRSTPPTTTFDAQGSLDLPARTLIGEPLPVTVTDLPAGATVDLVARPTGSGSRAETWRRTYAADDAGRIETAVGATGDDPAPGMVLAQFDPPDGSGSEPFRVRTDAIELRVRVRRGNAVHATGTTTRVYRDPEIQGESVEADDLVGSFYQPSSRGPHPPVVVLHGSGGTVPHEYCRLLATQGYATLGLQYFGAPEEIASELVEVPVEYVERAVEWLLSHSAVRDGGIGLVGVSRGVEPALLTAAAHDGPATVVGYGGSGMVFSGANGIDSVAWTRGGEPVVEPAELQRFLELLEDAQSECGTVSDCGFGEPERPCDALRCQLDHIRSVDEATYETVTTPVERVDGPVVLLTGSEDGVWNAPVFSEMAVDRLSRHDHDRYGHYVYEGAGHLFLRPYGQNRLLGGTRGDNAHAAVRSWVRAMDTLDAGLE